MKSKLANSLLIAACTLSCLSVQAEQKRKIDPSDPTMIATWVDIGAETQTIHDDAGNTGTVSAVRGEMNFAIGAEHLILTEFGYGQSRGINNPSSGMLDTRVRYFNLPYQNSNNNDFVQAAGWSIDVTAPTGDVKSGLGAGYTTVAVGGMTKHVINDRLMILPNVSYVHSVASGDLDKQLKAQGLNTTNKGIRADLFISYKFTDSIWGMAVPSYTKGLQGAADSANIKLYSGYMFSETDGVKLEYQANFSKERAQWKRVTQGMEDYLRVTYTHYF